MLHPVTFRALALAACGGLLACHAQALTLGRANGAVLLGRALDLTVQAELDAPAAAAPCAEAEAFYGDAGNARRVALRWEPTAGSREGVLRVTSSDPVDEPMVTLNVQLGCGRSISRRYVLLAEVPPAADASVPVVVTARPAPAQAASAPPPAVGTQSKPAPAAAPVTQSNPQPAAAPAQPRPRDTVAKSPAPAPAARPARPAAAALGASAAEPERGTDAGRLRLELLEPGAEREPKLRLSTELSPESSDPQARVAAAALWEVLRKGPEEAAQEAARVRNLEQELAALRTTTQQNAAAAARMREQVERTQDQRGQLVLAAGGLVLALAAFAGWALWRWRQSVRMARVGRWFSEKGDEPLVGPPEPPEAMPPIIADTPAPPPPPRSKAPAKPKAILPGVASTIARTKAAPSVWTPAESADFQPSHSATLRMVGVQELIDVHDKADFFFSIGQPDQAAAVLEAHVHDQVETSALPWLDLLELYHKQGLRTEYERLRAEFLQRFPAQVPDFDHFDQPTESLEDYERALSRIIALWPTRRVLDVIEEAIFRRPGVAGAESFSLEAYRELVLLYHVAMEVSPVPDQGYAQGEQRSAEFFATSLQPLATLDRPHVHPPEPKPGQDLEELLIPPSSRRIGVDIDLDEPSVQPELDEADSDLLDSEPPAAAAAPHQPPRAELPALDFDLDDSPAGDSTRKRE